MSPSSMCRVCLSDNIRMIHIDNSKLIEIYEKLSSSTLNTKDGIPQTICYICYSQLVKSCRFSDMAQKSQIILQNLVCSGTEVKHETNKSQNHGLLHSLSVTTILFMTINDSIPEDSWVKIKQDITEGTKSKNDEYIEIKESEFEEEIDIRQLSSNQQNSLNEVARKVKDDISFSDAVKVEDQTTENEDSIEIEECTEVTESKNDEYIEIKESEFEEVIDNSQLSSYQQNYLNDVARKEKDEISFSDAVKVEEETTKNEDLIEIEECTLETDIENGNMKNNKEISQLKERDVMKESYLVTVKVEQNVKEETTSKYEEFMEIEECTLENDIEIGHVITKKTENSLLKETVINDIDRKFNFYCDICNNQFASKYRLVAHLKIHNEKNTSKSNLPQREKSYVCQRCNRAFNLKSNLGKHMRTHTGEKPYACQICKKTFARNYDLTIHMKIHTGEKPFACNKCDMAFAIKKYLTKHMRIHAQKLPSCQKCYRTFTRKYDLTIHMRIHTKEKPYACQRCGKIFSLKTSLVTHIRNHTEEKLYACNHCDMTFSLKNHLGNHIRIHTGGKPYACKRCNMKFSQKKRLTSHLRIHTGEMPYACSRCDVKFARQRSLTTHMQIHTEDNSKVAI